MFYTDSCFVHDMEEGGFRLLYMQSPGFSLKLSICIGDCGCIAQHKPLSVRCHGTRSILGGKHYARITNYNSYCTNRGQSPSYAPIYSVGGGNGEGAEKIRSKNYRSRKRNQCCSPQSDYEHSKNLRPDRDVGAMHCHAHRSHGRTGRLAMTVNGYRNVRENISCQT